MTAEGMTGALLSPDGRLIVAMDRYREYYLCPVEGGEPRSIDGLLEGDIDCFNGVPMAVLFLCAGRRFGIEDL